jgi:hypothetical protein
VLCYTFAPISDIAENYFGGGYYGSATSINMFATIFLILYTPGTIFGIQLMERCKLKQSLEVCGFLTSLGAMLRWIAALNRWRWGTQTTYTVMMFGQVLIAISQPLYLNAPALVSAAWFPLDERDFATSVGAMAAPVGAGLGQLIPVFLVSQHSKQGKLSNQQIIII